MTERHKPPSLVLSLAERSSLMRYSVLFATITNPFTKQLMKLMKRTEMKSKKNVQTASFDAIKSFMAETNA